MRRIQGWSRSVTMETEEDETEDEEGQGQHETASYEGLRSELASSRFKLTGGGDAALGNLANEPDSRHSDHVRDLDFVYHVLQCIHCNV